MEVAPVLLALPILVWAGPRFPLTTLALLLVVFHGVVLMVGGAYSYARVPVGADVQALLGLSRNPYDRLGHLAQGFVPAIVIRDSLFVWEGWFRDGCWF